MPSKQRENNKPFAGDALDEVGFDNDGYPIYKYETRTGQTASPTTPSGRKK